MSDSGPLLSFPVAPMWRRVAATLVDLSLMAVLLFFAVRWVVVSGPGAPSTTVLLVLLVGLAVSPALRDAWGKGSPGQQLLGVRVVDARDPTGLRAPSLPRAVVRHLTKYGSHLLLPGLWRLVEVSLLRGRHLHEMLTGIGVLRTADLHGLMPSEQEAHHETLLRQMGSVQPVVGQVAQADPWPEVTEVYRLEDIDALDEAAELATRLAKSHPDSIECLTALARVQFRSGDARGLRQTLMDAKRLQPDAPSIGLIEAYVDDLEHGQGKVAARATVKRAQQVLARQPDHYLANLLAGYLLQSVLEDAAGATSYLIKAFEACPQRNRATGNLFDALVEQGLFDEAMVVYARSSAPGWSYIPIEYTFGTLMLNAGQLDYAIELLDTANRKMPGLNNVQHNRAICLRTLGRCQEAIEQWTEVLQREPDWEWALLGRARCHHQLDQYAQGLLDTRRVLSMDPLNIEARHVQSMLLSCLNDHRAALALCDAMQQDGQIVSADLHSWYAFCRLACGDISGAKAEYGLALAMDKADYFSNRGMAECLREELRPLLSTQQAIPRAQAQAMQDFAQTACELNPDSVASQELLKQAQDLVQRARA